MLRLITHFAVALAALRRHHHHHHHVYSHVLHGDDVTDVSGDDAGGPKPVQAVFTKIMDRVKSVDATSRPLPECSNLDCTQRIAVDVGLTFVKIVSVDQKEGAMKAVVWHKMTWTDYRLFFNASDLEGYAWDSDADFLPVDASLLWQPDVELLNAIAAPELTDALESRAYLYDEAKAKSAGYNVYLSVPMVVQTKCRLDLRLFPFDGQTCDLEYGAWSASRRFLALNTMDKGSAIEQPPDWNDEFDVTDIRVSKEQSTFQATGKTEFPTIVYHVDLERHARYYIVNYILPLGTLVVLSTASFWLDLHGGERSGYNTTVCLAIFAVAYLANEALPESRRDTWLERYQTWCLILALLPTIEASLLDSLAKLQGLRDPVTGKKVSRTSELVDVLFRVGHPLSILGYIAVVFLMNSSVRAHWSYEVSVNALTSVLLGSLVIISVLAIMRIRYDMVHLEDAESA